MADDLATYLQSRGDVLAVLGFSQIAEKPMNMLLHNGALGGGARVSEEKTSESAPFQGGRLLEELFL